MDDRQVVDAFVSYLRGRGQPELSIDRRPDEENRTTADIDAVAGPFAIEHTSVDTVPGQRRDSERFMRVAGQLEQELSAELSCRLNVTVEYNAIHVGQDWSAIRDRLKAWVTAAASNLADGRSEIAIEGVPFPLFVTKSSSRPAGLFFGRFEPADDTLPDRIRGAVERKARKLAPYRTTGFTTVLLVESGDIALMHDGKMLEAIRMAFPNGIPSSVDLVWYADTSIPEDIAFRELTRHIQGAV